MVVAGAEDGCMVELSGKKGGVPQEDVEIFVRPVDGYESSPSDSSPSTSAGSIPSNEVAGTPFVTTQRFEYPFPDTRYSPSEDRLFSLVSRPALPSSLSTDSNSSLSSVSSSQSSTSSRSSTLPPYSNLHLGGASSTWNPFPPKAFPLSFPHSNTPQHRFTHMQTREPPMPPSLRRKWQASSKSLDAGLRASRLNHTITDEDLQTMTEALSTLSNANTAAVTSAVGDTSDGSADESVGLPRPGSPEDMTAEQRDRGEGGSASELRTGGSRCCSSLCSCA